MVNDIFLFFKKYKISIYKKYLMRLTFENFCFLSHYCIYLNE